MSPLPRMFRRRRGIDPPIVCSRSLRAFRAPCVVASLLAVVSVLGCRVPEVPADAVVVLRKRIERPVAPEEKVGAASASAETDPGRAAELSEGWTIDEARYLAALYNPGLESLWHEWRATAERAPQARALPEPRFTYMEYIESVQTRTGPQERAFGLVIPLPWLEKPFLRGDLEEAAAAAAWQRFLAAQIALDHEVRVAVADYWLLARSIEVSREVLDLLARIERVARQKLAGGAPNHPDVIRLQLEIGRLEDRVVSLVDRRRAYAARLNGLLGRPVDAPIAWPGDLPEAAVLPPDEEVLDSARRHNPELAALAHEVERADVGRALASRQYFPDLAIGVQTIATGAAVMPNQRDSGEDPWMVSVSIDLPIWWSKYRAAEREAESRQQAARSRLADRERSVLADLEIALFELRDAKRRVALHEGTLIPKAEEASTATEAAYSASTADFLDLIDAERTLLELRLEAERARAERVRAEAKTDRLLGRYPAFDGVVEAGGEEFSR